jgi:hypothetical protein
MADIPISQLELMFEKMRREAGWDTEGELLWGYFFMDPAAERLRLLRAKLEAMGYRFVKLHRTDDQTNHVLHVERIEVHSPQSLAQRNELLNALADEFGVASYDGMDVGPVPAA